MTPDPAWLWLALLAKMACVAFVVVVASVVAERTGPFVAAMVATLPISAGPAYVFLAMDHGAAFIAQGTLASLAVNAATALLGLTYAWLAQRHGTAVSLAGAFVPWLAMAWLIRTADLGLAGGIALTIVCFGIAIPLSRRYAYARMPVRPLRRAFDLPLRAVSVALLVAVVTTISSRIGPTGSGIAALFPIVLTSVVVILHPRVGGPATAAVIANSLVGLVGFAMSIITLHLTAVPLGVTAGLLLALAVSVAWNGVLLLLRMRNARAQARATAAAVGPERAAGPR